ncbi:MAG: hypothetical protein HRT90_03915, partial [Candidatus Margulisbacteria bacterium]|nr:hypothetical protein [Candidatus Margulisiibacteriota bacterium]
MLLIGQTVWAFPNTVTFQALLSDDNTGLLNGRYTVVLTIYDENNTALWIE